MTPHRHKLRFIDVTLDELEIPGDPYAAPDRVIDRGVVPWAMVEHLRVSEKLPVSPALEYAGRKFHVIEGGRCVWAAKTAGWTKPFRSILFAQPDKLPPEIWERTWPFTQEAGADAANAARTEIRWQTLCFDRDLTRQEQLEVLKEVANLSALATQQASGMFAGVREQVWHSPRVLHWRTSVSLNSEDRSMAWEWTETIDTIRRKGIPLAAWNGRLC